MAGHIPTRITAFLLAAVLSQNFLLSSVNAQATSGCEHRSPVVIEATPFELTEACNAFTEVVNYFQSFSFDAIPDISITFRDRALGNSRNTSSTYGYFDVNQADIFMFRFPDSRPWGMDWSRQLAGSFLRHELVHAALAANLKNTYTCLRPEWHEFIAYTVQFVLMDAQLRTRLLERYSHVRIFNQLTEVNEFTSRTDPEVFAIAAYKTYLAKGADNFVRSLLLFEVQPPPISYPFPVLPDQIPDNEEQSYCTREVYR